jgi:hypothetical protein
VDRIHSVPDCGLHDQNIFSLPHQSQHTTWRSHALLVWGHVGQRQAGLHTKRLCFKDWFPVLRGSKHNKDPAQVRQSIEVGCRGERSRAGSTIPQLCSFLYARAILHATMHRIHQLPGIVQRLSGMLAHTSCCHGSLVDTVGCHGACGEATILLLLV